jgi:hypothetical protein
VFIAVFIVLWLAVISAGFAIYGVRPRGPGVKWSWWVAPSFIFAALGLGVGMPTLALLYSHGPRFRTSQDGLVLDKQELAGRTIFATVCKKCHTLGDAEAVGTIGPNLDLLKPSTALVVDAVTNGRARGRGQMPAMLVDHDGAEAVAAYLQRVAGHLPH